MDWQALNPTRQPKDRALVLIVDDDRLIRELWTRALKDRGYDVSAVDDGLPQ
jgi:CheY-like chemotaxis protein